MYRPPGTSSLSAPPVSVTVAASASVRWAIGAAVSTRREEAVALLDAARDAVALGAADIEACIERAFHAAHEDPRLRADVQALRIRHWNWAGNVANAAVLAGTEARLVEAHDPQRAARLAVEGLLGWI